ncbi:hypothetical protein L5M51_18780 [Shewanella sp. SM73]|uniref:hypothetical protein n=1 Tax=Shewanella sp. SM73 TaxID=2912806 RepID=UPI0021DAA74C|nr:hypothetical protein [Shewanella sp. SM73]MCU8031782.1 hypothetical protein [Shewanella sp. SM73]
MKKALLILLVASLTACSSPTRTDTDEFSVILSGNIVPDKVAHFVDCLTDGFNKAHWGGVNFEVRQSTRATGFRVETYTGTMNYLLMSADVINDGNVALYESSAAALINTTGEVEAFKGCLKQYQIQIN